MSIGFDGYRFHGSRPAVRERMTERAALEGVLEDLVKHLAGRHKNLTRLRRELSSQEAGRLSEIVDLLAMLHDKLTRAAKTTPTKALRGLLRGVEERLEAHAEMETAKRLF